MKPITLRRGRTVLPLLILTACLILSSCGVPKKNVGLASYNSADPFIAAYIDRLRKLSRPSFTLHERDGRNSQMVQNEQIEEMLRRELDLVIINPVDRLGVYPIIRVLKKMGTPVIFFNREPLREDLDLWEKCFYVGTRAEQAGELQARLVMELFGDDPGNLNRFDRNSDGRIQTVILKGEQGHQDAEIRTTVVINSFEERGFQLEVLTSEIADWNREEAYNRMELILNTHGDRMELILSNNDAMALGAIDRMRKDGWFKDDNGNGKVDREDSGWIPVVGIDGLSEAEEAIREGYLYGTVLNDSEEQARAIIELAAYLLGRGRYSRLSHPVEDDKYIWIDYKAFSASPEEEE